MKVNEMIGMAIAVFFGAFVMMLMTPLVVHITIGFLSAVIIMLVVMGSLSVLAKVLGLLK